MAKEVKRRRGTAAEHATFTGAVGEITYVTDDKSLRVHDGVTPGGHPVGSGDWSDIQNTPTTLQGYGIVNAYTKGEIDILLTDKANVNSTYLRSEIDTFLSEKASQNDLNLTNAKADSALLAIDGLAVENVLTVTGNYTITGANNGNLLAVDASSGPVILTLPEIASVGEPFHIKVKKIDSTVNAVTIVCTGTDTINTIASPVTISTTASGLSLFSDLDTSPDNWTTIDFGVMIGDSTPIGSEMWFSGIVPPMGWLVEDGRILSRNSYPALWAHAQASGMIVTEANWQSTTANRTKFSSGDGSTTFRLPDLVTGNLFVRAQPASASDFGRREEDDNKSHTHTVVGGYNAVGSGTVAPAGQSGDFYVFSTTTGLTGSSEARPKNAGRLPIIKAYRAEAPTDTYDFPQMITDIDDLQNRVTTLENSSGGSSGAVVQVKYVTNTDTTGWSTSNVIPFDSSIPQVTEGREVMSLVITPTSASNYLIINAHIPCSSTYNTTTQSNFPVVAAVFNGSANAVGAAATTIAADNYISEVNISTRILAGSTSPVTISVRLGIGSSGGTVYINGNGSSFRLGGVMFCSLQVMEVTP